MQVLEIGSERLPQAQKRTADLRVRVLKTVAELDSIRAMWESWPGHRDSDIDFFLAILQTNPRIVRPHIIVAERGGIPQAILVGRLDRGHIDFRMGYGRIRSKASVLYFVYGAHRGSESLDISRAFLETIQLCLSSREADAAYLNFLRTDSDLYRLARAAPGFLTRDYGLKTKPHYSLTVPNSADLFYAGLSSKVRKNQKRQAKKLFEDFHGAVKIREFRAPAEVPRLAELVEQVAKISYQRGLGVGFVDSAEERSRLGLAAGKGCLRAYVLYLEGRPCAFWVGVLTHGTFLSDYLGFDPAFAKHSPGMYLVMRVLESFCTGAAAVSKVDFANGDAQYKEVLSNNEWWEGPVYVFSSSRKGVQLSLLRAISGGINNFGQAFLNRTGLLQKVKKYWRARISEHGEN